MGYEGVYQCNVLFLKPEVCIISTIMIIVFHSGTHFVKYIKYIYIYIYIYMCVCVCVCVCVYIYIYIYIFFLFCLNESV